MHHIALPGSGAFDTYNSVILSDGLRGWGMEGRKGRDWKDGGSLNGEIK